MGLLKVKYFYKALLNVFYFQLFLMDENLNKFIKELSNIFDLESEDTYISIYLNRYEYDKFLDKRIKACRSVLKGDLLKNFNTTIKDVEDIIKKTSENNIAIFASHKHDFLKNITIPVKVKNILIVDSSPYIRPLAQILDEWESFSLVLINSNYAKIFSISLGKIEYSNEISSSRYWRPSGGAFVHHGSHLSIRARSKISHFHNNL